jgi:ubiquinone biosynthesis protein
VFGIVRRSVKLTFRSQQIGLTFYRYGLAGLLTSLGIEVGKRGLRIAKVTSRPAIPFDEVLGRDLARTFVKLGPTFIKLGQILASRPDLVGDPVAEQLKILFDRVPAVPFSEIQKILRHEIGRTNLKRWFQSIEPQALASASLSQTHRATLKDGTPLILKVQKNGVADIVRADLMILEAFIRPLSVVYPKLGLGQIFQDFKEGTLREIDYREEAKNIERFRKNYKKLFSDSDIMFPRYFPELTTERVLALEPMHGSKFVELRKGSTVAKAAASKSLAAVLEQIFDHGFFHADPHAGNLFFMEDEGRLGFIDLGLVGQLDPADKQKFLKVLLAILKRDREKLAKTLYELGTPGKKTNYDEFEQQIQNLLDEVKKDGIDNIRIDQMVNKLLTIARKNSIAIPNRYILMIRSCLIIEGVAKSLDPNVNVFSIATPIVAKSLMKSYSPINLIKKIF